MLVLLDRGFDATAFLSAVHRTGAMLLARAAFPARPTGPDSSARRLLPVRPRRAGGADHRGRRDDERRRRHRGRRPLPADHHAAGRRPVPCRCVDPALPRTLGDRVGLPRAAPHHARRARPTVRRPGRARTRGVGAADALPAAAHGHDHRGRDPSWHQSRPGQLHQRPCRPPATRSPPPPGSAPSPTSPPTSSVSSAGLCRPHCCPPGGPATARARSSARPRATSTATTAAPPPRPPSPGSRSACTSRRPWIRRAEPDPDGPRANLALPGRRPAATASPRCWSVIPAAPGAGHRPAKPTRDVHP